MKPVISEGGTEADIQDGVQAGGKRKEYESHRFGHLGSSHSITSPGQQGSKRESRHWAEEDAVGKNKPGYMSYGPGLLRVSQLGPT